ncbi:acetyl esterase/lipase [Aminobacter lissarensis]|uniref:Acetyl esterase/lipase n=1 Tax=Aminobacter carboxidus TaxID=376165 RepID=A0A8E1WG19_9HYPH|nr:alpha/beta hydrolase [Aminobacter lissarensis]MBB6468181.1 acetyl esterase/lipase [Aminobacter lissarensis]
MLERRIADWDNAYTNGANIAGGDRWPAAWVEPAQSFRDTLSATDRAQLDIGYGDKPRNRLDLFLPEGTPKGLVVFVHGGYWMALDKSYWSHLAKGSVDLGYAVAMPSYTLCPEVRIGNIVREVGAAIGKAAGLVDGPIMLTGHSAGGHLVSRMVASGSPLAPEVQARIRHVVSLSGVHDLRPLMNTGMNKTLHIDEAEALAESPALLRPMANVRITCWVGGGERAEFLRQNDLLANIWTGLGAATGAVVEPDRHHFSVIDGLADKDHALTQTLLG